MLNISLKVEFSAELQGTTIAWLVPGGDAAQWLEEIVAASVPTSLLTLYVIPKPSDDRHPQSVLIVPQQNARVENPCSRWQPYRQLAGNFFLPTNACLLPAIEEKELSSLLSDDAAAYLFHPTVGLIRFDDKDAIRVSDLLSSIAPRAANWHYGQPGIALASRLTSVEPIFTLELHELLEAARDDIGRELPRSDLLPPAPKEPGSGLPAKILLGAGGVLAATTKQLLRLIPEGTGAGALADSLKRMAQKFQQKHSQKLDAVRNREIRRLMHLLETDPDKGLRYALPLTGDPHRGIGTAGDRLVERSLGYRGGYQSGPADLWNLDFEHRQRLQQQYRDLALREQRLGRYGRAAYIFAELLGDFSAAAATLEQGRQFREAAIIYRERLRRPLEAAKCLERGGLMTEAISLYEELAEWEKVGDLYTLIEQPDQAIRAFETAIEKKIAGGDLLDAARMLQTKLQDADRAADVLWHAWPGSVQAALCLRHYFELLGKGLHSLSQKRVDYLFEQELGIDRTVQLLDQFVSLATGYPDSELQALAADRTRLLVARRLDGAGHWRGNFIKALGRLVPADRLLTADCQRFLAKQTLPVPYQPQPLARPKSACQLIRTFQLPDGVTWKTLISGGDMFVAAGFRGSELILVRGLWNGSIHQPSGSPWRVEPALANSKILMTADRMAMKNIFVHVPGAEPFRRPRTFVETDTFCGTLNAMSHPAFSTQTVAISCCPAGPIWQLSVQEQQFVLSEHQVGGQMMRSNEVALPDGAAAENLLGDSEPVPPLLLARNRHVIVASGDLLTRIGEGERKEIRMARPILGLSGSAIHSLARIAAVFERGGAVIWDSLQNDHVENFAESLDSPIAGFAQRGWLVAASKEECQVYESENRRLVFKATAPGTTVEPIAILSTDHADQFAVCDAEGKISIYQAPL